MLYAVIVLAAVAVGLLALVMVGQQRAKRLEGERDESERARSEAEAARTETETKLGEAETQVAELETRRSTLEATVSEYETKLEESNETLRKRTELADAQAIQIDAVSAERDELSTQLADAEERIVTMAARPGIVVAGNAGGDAGDGEANGEAPDEAAMLWQLELGRSERVWRNSVAINPVGDTSPLEDSDDPVRTAIEIEAAALREDVGALITVDWQAEPIKDPSRSLMVVRVAQEMLATASRAPGAARLIVASNDDGDLTLDFESDEDGVEINLIPPQISSDLIDVRNETTLAFKAVL